MELGNRLRMEDPSIGDTIHSPEAAAGLVQFEMRALEQEELRVTLLDARNRGLKIETIYRGSLNSSQIRVGELFKAAIRINAAALIVPPFRRPHTQPGYMWRWTRAIVQAGKLLDVDVLDHLVIGAKQYVSLKERGLGFA